MAVMKQKQKRRQKRQLKRQKRQQPKPKQRARNPRARKPAAPRKYRAASAAARTAPSSLIPSAAPEPPASPAKRPRARRVSTAAARTELIHRFYGSLPATKWDEILGSEAADSKGGRLMALMHDPLSAEWPLERMCAVAEIDFEDLVRIVSTRVLGSALMASTPHVTEVIDGLAEDAKSHLYTCDLCVGERVLIVASPNDAKVKRTIDCPKCGGTGSIRRGGDARKAETFLKLHGALQEPEQKGVVLNQQFNFGAAHSFGVQRGQQLLAEGRKISISAIRSAPAAAAASHTPENTKNTENSEISAKNTVLDAQIVAGDGSEGADGTSEGEK